MLWGGKLTVILYQGWRSRSGRLGDFCASRIQTKSTDQLACITPSHGSHLAYLQLPMHTKLHACGSEADYTRTKVTTCGDILGPEMAPDHVELSSLHNRPAELEHYSGTIRLVSFVDELQSRLLTLLRCYLRAIRRKTETSVLS